MEELFVRELADIYSAEKQLVKALPDFARASASTVLSDAIESHRQQTQGQVERIDLIADQLGVKLKQARCAAMEELIGAGKETIGEFDPGPLRDTALIGGAQKVEHYQIAAYGMLEALAKRLELENAVPLLRANLDEEIAAEMKLALLAGRGGERHVSPGPP